MAICEKCGKEYNTIVCVRCRNKEQKNRMYGDPKQYEKSLAYRNKITKKEPRKEELTEKEKLYKTIRYVILISIGLVISGIILDIYIFNKAITIATPAVNNMNEISNDLMQLNKKLIKDLNHGFKPINFNNSQRGN